MKVVNTSCRPQWPRRLKLRSALPRLLVLRVRLSLGAWMYEGRTESHEQLFLACELGTADEGECGGR